MLKLHFSAEGLSSQEIEVELDKIIEINNPDHAVKCVEQLVQKYNVRCAEIESYIRKHRPLYLKSLKKEMDSSTEWPTAKGRKKRQLLHSFKLKAVQTLDIHSGNFTYNLFPLVKKEGPEAWTVAHIIYGTYFRIKAAMREREGYLSLSLTSIKGFKIFNSEKSCPFCRHAAKKIYQRDNLPLLPFHVGCGCWLAPIFDWEI